MFIKEENKIYKLVSIHVYVHKYELKHYLD